MSFSKKVYSEIRFLKIMCEAAEDDSLIGYEEKKVWRALYRFVYYNNIEIHIDCNTQEWRNQFKQSDKTLKKAVKKGAPIPLFERLICRLEESAINDQEHVQLIFGHSPLTPETISFVSGALYFTMLEEVNLNRLSELTDCLLISPHNIKMLMPLTNDCGIPITKEFSGSWENVLENCNFFKWRQLPYNHIIVVDNYLLNDTNRIEENLKPLLECLLPQHLSSHTFSLTVISSFRNDRGGNDLDFDSRWKKLCDIINSLSRSYSITLLLVKCGNKTFHDRTIITDNMWISCGAGFDLFKNGRASKPTITNVVAPCFNDRINWAFNAYANLMDAIEKVLKDSPTYGDCPLSNPLYKRKCTL